MCLFPSVSSLIRKDARFPDSVIGCARGSRGLAGVLQSYQTLFIKDEYLLDTDLHKITISHKLAE